MPPALVGSCTGPNSTDTPAPLSSARAALEREVVHWLLAVLVRLDRGREADEIAYRGRRTAVGVAVDVDVRRDAVPIVAAEVAAHRLRERLTRLLHLEGREQSVAHDEVRVDGADREHRMPHGHVW
jgi:DNA-binding protein